LVDFIGKEILVEGFKVAFEKILGKINKNYFNTIEKRTRLAEALTSINQAIIETKRFIRDEGYFDNTELSKLWHEAFNKSVAADLEDGLPEYLYHKADFWGDPQEWINNPASLEIVPKLRDLKRLCDGIMVRISK
jgi:hypothetical protein